MMKMKMANDCDVDVIANAYAVVAVMHDRFVVVVGHAHAMLLYDVDWYDVAVIVCQVLRL